MSVQRVDRFEGGRVLEVDLAGGDIAGADESSTISKQSVRAAGILIPVYSGLPEIEYKKTI